MKDIEEYLTKYWEKYPQEKENDYTIEEVKEALSSVCNYFLDEHLFILYSEVDTHVYVYCYWCDVTNISKRELKKEFITHKRFIKSFNKPVYIPSMKSSFIRDYMIEYDNELKLWRFL